MRRVLEEEWERDGGWGDGKEEVRGRVRVRRISSSARKRGGGKKVDDR